MVANPRQPEFEQALAEEAAALDARFGGRSPREIIAYAARERFRGELAAVSSFGADSAVLLHMIAEVDPSQKERIILALQKTGHVVGFLGEGINDAPALHVADAGISVFMGRRYGAALLKRFAHLTPAAQQVNRLLLRYQTGMIIGVRFMYGLRIAGPIAIGMSDVPAWRFILFNLIGTALLALLVSGAGYLFGQTLHGCLPISGDMRKGYCCWSSAWG